MSVVNLQIVSPNSQEAFSGFTDIEELEKRRQRLAEAAALKNKHLKSVIDKLRSILAALDCWND